MNAADRNIHCPQYPVYPVAHHGKHLHGLTSFSSKYVLVGNSVWGLARS
jgi:hypothetical protein